jgi:hypothetical protein
MAHNYILQVTAGPEYDIKTHTVVPVNSATPVSIDSDLVSVDLNVRIQVPTTLPTPILPAHLHMSSHLTPITELPRTASLLPHHLPLLQSTPALQKRRSVLDCLPLLPKAEYKWERSSVWQRFRSSHSRSSATGVQYCV